MLEVHGSSSIYSLISFLIISEILDSPLQILLLSCSLPSPVECMLDFLTVFSVSTSHLHIVCVYYAFLLVSSGYCLLTCFSVYQSLLCPNTINPIYRDLYFQLLCLAVLQFLCGFLLINSISLITFFTLSSVFLNILVAAHYNTHFNIRLMCGLSLSSTSSVFLFH